VVLPIRFPYIHHYPIHPNVVVQTHFSLIFKACVRLFTYS
jgi:hypothetical protein